MLADLHLFFDNIVLTNTYSAVPTNLNTAFVSKPTN